MIKRLLVVFILIVCSLVFYGEYAINNETHEDKCEYVHNDEIYNTRLIAYEYNNVCWRCHASISSKNNSRCSRCGWYICNNCGACESTCSRCPSWSGNKSSGSSSKKDNSWVWILVVGGVIVGGVVLFRVFKKR